MEEILNELKSIRADIKELKTAFIDNKAYTVNELVQAKTIGGYVKIKSLIRSGLIKTTKDGKITQTELNNYLKNN